MEVFIKRWCAYYITKKNLQRDGIYQPNLKLAEKEGHGTVVTQINQDKAIDESDNTNPFAYFIYLNIPSDYPFNTPKSPCSHKNKYMKYTVYDSILIFAFQCKFRDI